jgi:LPS-assembly lipoprotein
MKTLCRLFGFAASLLLAAHLTGCGFELRGRASLPDDIRSVHVNAPAELRDELQIFLEGGGAELAESGTSADVTINVSSETYDRRVLTVDPNTGKEREFELAYSVVFDVKRANGIPVLASQSVSLIRDYVFDPDAVIGKSREEGVLREEMRRDAAQQILRRIRAAISR